MSAASLDRRGLWAAAGAFVVWGLMPLYWHLLKAVPSLQIVLHRVAWGTVTVCAWLWWKQGRGWVAQALRQPRAAAMLAVSGLLIAFNWSLYIWAVNAGHVIETSLGYFINPLVNVVLGVALLHERLNRTQWVAVGIAALGVLWLTFNYGSFPWIALLLAGSFALYGLVRKLVAVDAVAGLGVENLYLFLPALAWLGWIEAHGGAIASGAGVGTVALLAFGGVLTVLPLVGFAYGVRRIPYSTVGLLQYIAPTLQLLCGILFFREPFGADRAIGFACIWAALAAYAFDGWRRARRMVAAAAA